jgi:plastocyanin
VVLGTIEDMQTSNTKRPWTIRGGLALGALAVLGACGGGTAEEVASSVVVTIVADGGVGTYDPADVRVATGGTVEWVNESGYVHNVVFGDDDGIEPSPLFTDDERWSTTFPEAGSYSYICTLHPTMTGSVEVVDVDR